jgi:hypothetical protein
VETVYIHGMFFNMTSGLTFASSAGTHDLPLAMHTLHSLVGMYQQYHGLAYQEECDRTEPADSRVHSVPLPRWGTHRMIRY